MPNTQLFHLIIRMNKNDSAFFYFQLEANEGLSFYSTLPYEHHSQVRDVELKGDVRLKADLVNLIQQCEKKFKLEILVDQIISNN